MLGIVWNAGDTTVDKEDKLEFFVWFYFLVIIEVKDQGAKKCVTDTEVKKEMLASG